MDSEVWWALIITWKHQLHGHIDLDLSHQIPAFSWAIWLILLTSSSSDHKPEPLNDLNKVFTSFTSAMSAYSCPGKRKSGKKLVLGNSVSLSRAEVSAEYKPENFPWNGALLWWVDQLPSSTHITVQGERCCLYPWRAEHILIDFSGESHHMWGKSLLEGINLVMVFHNPHPTNC